ncbi:hypothetical protein MKP05_10745 [Halomonas sp. EGI 63088]|uniref:Uncharacterized protein n=1 Tax=Halomonas flagellata TaxID=2920385 RepID=A0ABS9RUT0_9GAMM|nr:hypothetical protein [Halomonas flagellata]MCH4563606.1 hypothetical protein [Halomonas flagellata]
MNKSTLTVVFATPFVILLSGPAKAFECPQHFAAAQAAIDKVSADMQGMGEMMDRQDMALVHALLDDAKALLTAARHNHERPQGPYDHARAIAKADSAQGYATAADVLHFHYMEQQ